MSSQAQGIRVCVLLVLCLLSLSVASAAPAEVSNDTALKAYYSANGLLNRGLYDLAAKEYAGFLAEHEDHEKAPTAQYGLSVCLYRLGRHQEAADQLDKLASQNEVPYAAEVWTMLGQCRLALGEHSQAADAFGVVIKKYAKHDLADDATAGAAESSYLAGDYESSITMCRRLATRWPDSPLRIRSTFFWGLALMAGNEHDLAAARFSEVIEADSKGPFSEQASLLLAQCYHHDRLIIKAASQYEKLIKRPQSGYIPDALFGLALLALGEGKWEDSGRYLDRLISEYSDNRLIPQATFHRGRVYFELNEAASGLALFEKVRGNLNDASLHDDLDYWVAKCKLRLGQFQKAADGFAVAIKAHPKSDLLAEMLYDRSVALARTDNLPESLATLEEFIRRYPDHEMMPDALHLLASSTHQTDQHARCEEYCRKFLKQFGDHSLAPSVMFLMGESQFLSDELADAIITYRLFLDSFLDNAMAQRVRYRLGVCLYQTGEHEEAARFLGDVAEEARSDDQLRFALLALGDIHFGRSEWKQAEKYLGQYLSAGAEVSSADDAMLKLGIARQRQEDHAGALRSFDQLLGSHPQSTHRLQALFERGQALLALDRSDDARACFEQVVEEGGESRFKAYALNHLGSLAMKRGAYTAAANIFGDVSESRAENLDEADSSFQRGQALLAAGEMDGAFNVLVEFIERYPKHEQAPLASAQAAICLSRLGRFDDALSAIGVVERKLFDKLAPKWQHTLLYEKAWCLRETDKQEQAAVTYRTLLEKDPETGIKVHALLDLASLEMKKGRFAEASDLLRELRDLGNEHPGSMSDEVKSQQIYSLGACEFELKHFEEAAALFEEFITLSPESPQLASASFFCGESLYNLGKHSRAAVHLTRVIDDFASDEIYGPSLLRLGECSAVLQRWPRSEQVFSEYLRKFGDSPLWYQAQFGVGWARENQSRHDEAILAYRDVVGRHEGETAARAQFQIGECLFAKKMYEKAAAELLKVDILYAYPQWSAGALYEAGRCFEKLGKTVEARAQFQALVDKHGDSRWAEMGQQRLAKLSSKAMPGT